MFRPCIAALFPASGVVQAAAGAARTSCVAVVCPSSPLCRSRSSTAVASAKLPLLSSAHCPPSFFGRFPAALFTSRRYQRSTPARTHTSTWQDKTHRFEKYQREQQDEALRAAQRRAKYATGTSASADTSTLSATSFSKSASATEPLTRPSGGFWSFMRGGSEGRKTQPMNPLMHLSKWGEKSKHDPEARTAQRLLEAINGLNKRNSRRREPLTVQLSDTQKQEIVNRYASTRWYARLYAPFRSWSERRVRWGIRICNVVLVFIVSCLIVVMVTSYFREMDAIAQLSPEDQRDYAYMVRGMRYSDIYKVGAEVLKKEDPLEALPPAVRLHMVIEACRQKKWHELDWNVELRKMHPASPLEEWDYLHLLYWAILTIGSLTSGGGVMFSDRVLDVREVRHGNAESDEEKDRFVEMEPTSLPARKQRTFF